MLGKIGKDLANKSEIFFVRRNRRAIALEVSERHIGAVILAVVDLGRGELVADTLYDILVGNDRLYLTVEIAPVFEMMRISSLVVEPGTAKTGLSSAHADRGAIAPIVADALEKFDGREF